VNCELPSSDQAIFRLFLGLTEAAALDEPARGRLFGEICRHLQIDVLYHVLPASDQWAKVGFGPEGARGRSLLCRPTGIIRHVLSRRSSVLQRSLGRRGAFNRNQDGWPGHQTASYLAVPIHQRRSIKGVLVCLRGTSHPPFDLADLVRAELLADAIGIGASDAKRIAELEKLSRTDEVTGLPNSRWAQESLRAEIRTARQLGETFSIVIVEVRQAIGGGGPMAKAETLARLARNLEGLIRGKDRIARIGVDEFLVILPRTPAEGAHCAARRIGRGIAAGLHELSDEIVPTCTCGIATYPGDGPDDQTLLAAAGEGAVDLPFLSPLTSVPQDRGDGALRPAA
jgi:diguanylate cyclase (GGDEF)-like protein